MATRYAAVQGAASGHLTGVLLGTLLNVMAFTMPNVIFSWVAGAVLVAVGMIGRKEQIERLHDADRHRSGADRAHAWEESDHRHGSPSV